EHAGDAPLRRPDPALLEAVEVAVELVRGVDLRLLSLDPRHFLRRRIHLRRRQAFDALDLPFLRRDVVVVLLFLAVAAADHDLGIGLLVAIETDHEVALARHAELATVERHFRSRLDVPEHETALLPVAADLERAGDRGVCREREHCGDDNPHAARRRSIAWVSGSVSCFSSPRQRSVTVFSSASLRPTMTITGIL